MPNLTSSTTYYYRVSSADGQLNVATSPPVGDPPTTFATTAPQPSITIGDVSVTEGNGGTTNAVFNVTLSASSTATVTVQFATSGGTATADTDFVTTSGPLDFTPGQTQRTITVPVVGDLLNEVNEQFTVNLTGAVNATIADGQGVGTILNDDPIPTVSIADASVSEGQSGTKVLAFNATLSAASGQIVTVSYATANGTATAGTDYVAATSTATFNPGQTTVPINITVNGDTTSEPDEQFVVNLSNPANATIADGQATGGILNDDGVPTLSITDVTVTEGNTGSVNATLTVSLSAASAAEVTVGYATANISAAAGTDYTGGSGTLSFTSGITTRTIVIPVLGDTADEINETFAVNLSAPTNATIADPQGIVTITDNDATPTLAVSNGTVTEGNSGTVNASVTVSLSAASGHVVTVAYATANGTATGTDYTPASGTLTFAAGVASQTVTVPIAGDVLDEADETIQVNLSAPTNATIADAQGIVTITDDDATPTVTVGDVSLTEGNSGTKVAAFNLTLSAASGRTVTVRYG
ncbi:MAG: Calx-beta domain-containing protein, partial [Vicinamibacterales bacterium]